MAEDKADLGKSWRNSAMMEAVEDNWFAIKREKMLRIRAKQQEG